MSLPPKKFYASCPRSVLEQKTATLGDSGPFELFLFEDSEDFRLLKSRSDADLIVEISSEAFIRQLPTHIDSGVWRSCSPILMEYVTPVKK